MDWESSAQDRRKKLLENFSAELTEEAGRIAQRARAGAVSAAYVDDAANRIGMRRPGVMGDIFLSVGLALAAAAAGVWVVVLTETAGSHLQLGWVKPAAIGVAVAGSLLAGIGITLKVKA